MKRKWKKKASNDLDMDRYSKQHPFQITIETRNQQNRIHSLWRQTETRKGKIPKLDTEGEREREKESMCSNTDSQLDSETATSLQLIPFD